MKPPVVGNGGTRDPKQPGAQTARVTLEIETTHHFEKDLRCQVLGLLAIFHLARDEAVDQAKVFLVKGLKIPCIHLFHSFMLSDNNSSRYRQLEWPIRKENIQPMQEGRSAPPHEKSSLGGIHLCSLKKEAWGSRIYEATRWRGKIRGRVTRSSSNDNYPHPGSSDNYKSHVNAKNCQHTGDTDTYECSDTTSQRGHQARQMAR